MSDNNPYASPGDGHPSQGQGTQPQYGAPQPGYQPAYGQQPYGQQPYGGQPYQGQPAPYGGMPSGVPEYANWGQRVGAYLIDMLLLIPGYLLIIPAMVMMGRTSTTTQCFDSTDPSSCYPVTEPSSPGILAYLLLIAGYALMVGLMIWNRWIKGGKGQSLGKKALGISLISENTGRPIGGGMAFVRDIAHFLDGLPCYLGYLWPLWDAKRQTFSDKVISTVVVKGPPPEHKY